MSDCRFGVSPVNYPDPEVIALEMQTTSEQERVVMVLQPCDRVLPQCDKLKIEQHTRKETENDVYYNKMAKHNKNWKAMQEKECTLTVWCG